MSSSFDYLPDCSLALEVGKQFVAQKKKLRFLECTTYLDGRISNQVSFGGRAALFNGQSL